MDRHQSTEQLLEQLNALLSESWQMPLSGGKVLVEKDRIADLMNEINSTFPPELRQAQAVLNSQSELKRAAERDAEAILKDAETKARKLVDDTVIVREAKRVTTEMLNQKKAEAQALMEKVTAQANAMLNEAKNRANQILAEANAKSAEIVKNSEAHAAEVTRNAEKMSRDLRTATSAYVENSISSTEQALVASMNELKRIKQQVRTGAGKSAGM